MTWRFARWAGAAAAVSLGGLAAWLASLPEAPADYEAPPIGEEEAAATIAALRPPKRKRPLIAIVGINDWTETTDFMMPAGILRRADIADVVLVATKPGLVQLYPALKVEPDTTIASFDVEHPTGADYVIVPAMSRDDDPQVLDWLKRQAAGGAVVVGVCVGAKVVGAAGLLDGRKATTHWYYLGELFRKHPAARYIPDRRLIVDRGVATTTGITASMPMMLTLIEAIGGRAKAEAVAADLGVEQWSARHASRAFLLTRRFARTVLSNQLAFWKRERLGIELRPGVDEVSLALVADAWSRTYRSRAFSFAASGGAVRTRNGLRVVPDSVSREWPGRERLDVREQVRPSDALDRALAEISQRYGVRTAEVVAMQLEYPRGQDKSTGGGTSE